MKDNELTAKKPFRFLRPHEFAALTQEEKAKYLQQAIDAVKRGDPLDDLPAKDPH